MGFIDICCSVASSIGSAFSSAVSSIGRVLSSFAEVIAPVIGSIIEALQPVAEAIGTFANAFLQALGIIKPDERVEDLGDRALQAAEKGITMDQFENFDDYMAALRNFDLDPEKTAKRSHAEKLTAGLGVGTCGVEHKFNAEPGSLKDLWLLPMSNPVYFTPERMTSLLTTGRLGGDIFSYLEQKLSGGDARAIEKKLEVGLDGQPMGEADLGKLYEALDSAHAKWTDMVKQVEARHKPEQGTQP